jgi:hypothetical protein
MIRPSLISTTWLAPAIIALSIFDDNYLNGTTMAELMTFIGNLNLGTFIILWTSTIILIILVSLLLVSVGQVKREATMVSNRVKKLVAEFSEQELKLGNDSI